MEGAPVPEYTGRIGMTRAGRWNADTPYDNLEFRLEHTTVNGQVINAIVCEGIVVRADRRPGRSPPKALQTRLRIVENWGSAEKRRG